MRQEASLSCARPVRQAARHCRPRKPRRPPVASLRPGQEVERRIYKRSDLEDFDNALECATCIANLPEAFNADFPVVASDDGVAAMPLILRCLCTESGCISRADVDRCVIETRVPPLSNTPQFGR